jgi:hypothetical protein
MSIRFVCERCGHEMDVPDGLAGVHGKCKHCGHHLTVPEHEAAGADTGLRLREAAEEPPRLPAHLLAAEAPLTVRAAEAEPRRRPEAVSEPDETPPAPEHRRGRAGDQYGLADGGRDTRPHSSAGPPPLWVNLPTLTARLLARNFRTLRDWLYVVSVGALVVVLLGYLYHSRLVLHLGAAVVIASNISMLVVGFAYLVMLPFKESFWIGMANVFVPFYAVYYWVTRWPKMKRPVLNTLGSFVPILLVGLAYLVWKEAPVVERAIEKELPALEERLEKKLPALEKGVDRVLPAAPDPLEPRSGAAQDDTARGPDRP